MHKKLLEFCPSLTADEFIRLIDHYWSFLPNEQRDSLEQKIMEIQRILNRFHIPPELIAGKYTDFGNDLDSSDGDRNEDLEEIENVQVVPNIINEENAIKNEGEDSTHLVPNRPDDTKETVVTLKMAENEDLNRKADENFIENEQILNKNSETVDDKKNSDEIYSRSLRSRTINQQVEVKRGRRKRVRRKICKATQKGENEKVDKNCVNENAEKELNDVRIPDYKSLFLELFQLDDDQFEDFLELQLAEPFDLTKCDDYISKLISDCDLSPGSLLPVIEPDEPEPILSEVAEKPTDLTGNGVDNENSSEPDADRYFSSPEFYRHLESIDSSIEEANQSLSFSAHNVSYFFITCSYVFILLHLFIKFKLVFLFYAISSL